jgi:hypothetical protein
MTAASTVDRFGGQPQRPSLPAGAPKLLLAGWKLEKLCRSCRKKRSGAAVVEFAIILPICVLVVGMIQYGRVAMVQQILTNASGEVARIGGQDGPTTAKVETAAAKCFSGDPIPDATVTIAQSSPSSADYEEPVSVTVAIPFNQVRWLPSPMFLGGSTLSAASAMRCKSVH